tara:strand:+ start:21162 stop:22097 length:936 start_codon:yes stop_codon:yes gene_type:complete
MDIVKYNVTHREQWNEFVKDALKSTFLFHRDFMEYHSDRFLDHSLLFFKNDAIVAVLPGNQTEGLFISHQGLTYGGFVYGKMSSKDMLQIMELLLSYLKINGFKKIIYKALPNIFQSSFHEVDLYALHIKKFKLDRRDLSFVIDLKSEIKYAKDRKYRINKSKRNGLTIQKSEDFKAFMQIVNDNLQSKYNKQAIHTADEIKRLYAKFPDNIKLLVVHDSNDALVGGSLLFLDNNFIHTQYLHSNLSGKKLDAKEFLVDHLIQSNKSYNYLSFGISTENEGKYLNEGLASYKEGFGARCIVHDFYELKLDD